LVGWLVSGWLCRRYLWALRLLTVCQELYIYSPSTQGCVAHYLASRVQRKYLPPLTPPKRYTKHFKVSLCFTQVTRGRSDVDGAQQCCSLFRLFKCSFFQDQSAGTSGAPFIAASHLKGLESSKNFGGVSCFT